MRAVAFAVLLASFASAPALAIDGAWRVGDGLVISTAGLDLTAQRDREALLVRLETSAARLCRDVHPRVERLACEADAVARAVASAPKLAEAIEKAKAERRPSRLAALSGAN